MYRLMDGCIIGWIAGYIDGRLDAWIVELMDGWVVC